MSTNADRTAVGSALSTTIRAGLPRRAGAVALGLAAVALTVVELPHDAGAAAARLATVTLPVAFALYRLARVPDDRFARLLLGTGALLSLATLSESGHSTAYSVGRVSAWLVDLMV